MYSADVHDVKGLDGCFIANQHLTTTNTNGDMVEVNKTVITWNAGKHWDILSPPKKKNSEGNWSDGGKYSGDDQLNLHLEKTETSAGYHAPSIQTKESTPGYIIGR